MKAISILLLVLSFFVLLFSLAGVFLSFTELQTEEIYTSVNITSGLIGFDVNGTALTFGEILAGGSVTRSVNFQNGYSFPVIVKTNVEGDIEKLLNFEEVARVEEGETKRLSFDVSVYEDIEKGFYDGMVEIVIQPARE
jgi:hypothetical protein